MRFILALTIMLFAAPALADPLADLAAVHAEMRAGWASTGDARPENCRDWARWAQARLSGYDAVFWTGPDLYRPGVYHAVTCVVVDGKGWVCVDRNESTLQPLAAYGPEWHAVGLLE